MTPFYYVAQLPAHLKEVLRESIPKRKIITTRTIESTDLFAPTPGYSGRVTAFDRSEYAAADRERCTETPWSDIYEESRALGEGCTACWEPGVKMEVVMGNGDPERRMSPLHFTSEETPVTINNVHTGRALERIVFVDESS